jgi:ribose 5-phosphate isomerase B
MKVAVGGDHRGFQAKQLVKAIVTQMGHECVDLGTDSENPVDYPDIAYAVAKAVSEKKADKGILICATGLGMSIAANKIRGIRAALCHDELSAYVSRDHNDANILCLSGDQVGEVLLRKIVETWLTTDFIGGRHQRRVNKINAIERGVDPRTITNG